MMAAIKAFGPILIALGAHIVGFLITGSGPFWLSAIFRAPMVLTARAGDLLFGLARVPRLIGERTNVLWPELLLSYLFLLVIAGSVDWWLLRNVSFPARLAAAVTIVFVLPLLVGIALRFATVSGS